MANNFDTVAKEWDANPLRKKIAQHVITEIKKNVKLHSKVEALDYGTGTGLILLGIQPYIASITGMDNSQGMLDVLQEKLTTANIKNASLFQHNIETNDLGKDKFDLIVSSMTLHHIADTSDFFKKAFDALKSGGKICIADLETEDGSFHQNQDMSVKHLGFDIQIIKTLIDKIGFASCKVYPFFSIKKETDTGVKTYPLLMAVATKE